MALKSYNPVTPSRRNMTAADYSILTTDKPEKSLTVGKKSSGGRNNYGRVTTRFRGGANKRSYRLVDFKRNKDNVPATVKSIEYDPTVPHISPLYAMPTEKRLISFSPTDLMSAMLL